MEKPCIGDNYNIACPYCGKFNHYVCNGRIVNLGTILNFQKECTYCDKIISYRARYEIKVVAFIDNPDSTL